MDATFGGPVGKCMAARRVRMVVSADDFAAEGPPEQLMPGYVPVARSRPLHRFGFHRCGIGKLPLGHGFCLGFL